MLSNSITTMRRIILLTTLQFILIIHTHAQGQLEKLNIYFNNLSRQQYMNGNILLAESGRAVYQRSFGYADYTTAIQNDQNTHYNIASISKIFTSTAILQLKEKGKLKLDDTLCRHLPAFPYPQITIRHLLTHTSGLPDLELYEPLIKKYPDTVVTNEIIIPVLIQEKRKLYFTPGDQFSYCNTNFELLALLVEKLSGISFPAYLEKNIFQPAGMLHTRCVQRGTQMTTGSVATPHVKEWMYDSTYRRVFDVKRYRYTSYNNDAAIGASNIVTTTGDMQLFDKAFFEGKLINKASMAEAFTPLKLNNKQGYWEHMDTMQGEGKGSYGLGWEIFDQPGFGRSVGHGGFKFGLATFYFHNIEKKQAIIAFDNTAAPAFGSVITSAFHIMNKGEAMPLNIRNSVVRVYAQTMVRDGANKALTCLNLLKADTLHYYFSEREMNQLGYEFLYFAAFPDHKQLAVETFKVNMLLFPESYNTYDSYAEALADTGNKQDAILMYRKSIEMNPGNQGGIAALKRLLSQ